MTAEGSAPDVTEHATPLSDLRRLTESEDAVEDHDLEQCDELTGLVLEELGQEPPVTGGRRILLLRKALSGCAKQCRQLMLARLREDKSARGVGLGDAAAAAELLGFHDKTDHSELREMRGHSPERWRKQESANSQPRQLKQLRGGPWRRQQPKYSYKAVEDNETVILQAFLSKLKAYLHEEDVKEELIKLSEWQPRSTRNESGAGVGTNRMAIEDEDSTPSHDARLLYSAERIGKMSSPLAKALAMEFFTDELHRYIGASLSHAAVLTSLTSEPSRDPEPSSSSIAPIEVTSSNTSSLWEAANQGAEQGELFIYRLKRGAARRASFVLASVFELMFSSTAGELSSRQLLTRLLVMFSTFAIIFPVWAFAAFKLRSAIPQSIAEPYMLWQAWILVILIVVGVLSLLIRRKDWWPKLRKLLQEEKN